MGRRTTKTDVILAEARQQIAAMESRVTEAEALFAIEKSNVNAAYAALDAQKRMYSALERALATSAPRGSTTPKPPKPTASKSAKKSSGKKRGEAAEPLCADCGIPELHQIHLVLSHTNYHSFVRPNAKRRARLPMDDRRDDSERCHHVFPDQTVCLGACDQNIHQLRGVTNFHPFVAPSVAPNVQRQSLANGAGASSIPSTTSEAEDALAVGVSVGGE